MRKKMERIAVGLVVSAVAVGAVVWFWKGADLVARYFAKIMWPGWY